MSSLYDRLGGQPALEGAVFLFYEKMLTDARVSHYFANLDMTVLQQKMIDMLAFAFGDTERSSPKDLALSHAHLNITQQDFDITAGHLSDTLNELALPPALHDEVMGIVASTQSAVVTA